MARSNRRGPWLPEEDATLLHLVGTQGPNNWVRISQHMQHRSPKQCRERYHQNLKASLNHEPISAQEGELIEQLVRDIGKRWAEIARRLGNRSDNAVKNWWNGSMNRRKRGSVHHLSGGSKTVGYRSQPIPTTLPPDRHAYSHERRRSGSVGTPFTVPLPPFQGTGAEHDAGNFIKGDLHSEQSEFPLFQSATAHSIAGAERGSSLPSTRAHHAVLASTSYGDSHQYAFPREPSPWRRPGSGNRIDIQLPPLHTLEPPMPSPAATEVSHTSSGQQAPSLISDNQSNCSISPKTTSSPRPGMPTSVDISLPHWRELTCKTNPLIYETGRAAEGVPRYQDEGYVSVFPPTGVSESKEALPDPMILPPLLTAGSTNEDMSRPWALPQHSSSPGRPYGIDCHRGDSRMRVSRLLE